MSVTSPDRDHDRPPDFVRVATRTGIPPIRRYLHDAFRYRQFALRWSLGDIKARNYDTRFGRLWHVINPLLFGVIYFVFVGILSGGIGDAERLAFIVGNLYVWMFFSGLVTTVVGSIQGDAGGVLAQSAIPRIVLPLASTVTSLNLFVRSLLAYVPIHFLAGRGLHLEILAAPVLIVLTAMFGLGLGMTFAVLNVYLRDVSRFLPHVLRLWLYLSPVIWEYTRLNSANWMEVAARFNPMFAPFRAWTIAFGGPLGDDGDGVLLLSMLEMSAWSLAALVVGFVLFVSREDEFALRN